MILRIKNYRNLKENLPKIMDIDEFFPYENLSEISREYDIIKEVVW